MPKTHAEMTADRAWQQCQAGHDGHDRVVVDTDLGPMTVYDFKQYMGFDGYCSGQDDVSRTLHLYGRWEVEETLAVRQVLEAGDRQKLFVDVGSHIGWFSRLANQYGYRSLGFEADEENIELCGLNTTDTMVTHTWFGAESAAIECPGPVELLKVDIEGAEEHALRAVWAWINLVGNILMEVSPVFNDTYPDLVASLVGSGFAAFCMDGRPFDGSFNFHQTNLLFRRAT